MRTLLAVTALALLLAAPASAEVFSHADAGVEFDVPAKWKVEQDGDAMMAMSPKEDAFIIFSVMKGKEVKQFLAGIDKELASWMNNIKVTTDATTEKVNALTQHYMEGTGVLTDGGVDVHWDLTLVEGAKKPMFVLAVGANLDGDQVKKVYSSIRRLK